MDTLGYFFEVFTAWKLCSNFFFASRCVFGCLQSTLNALLWLHRGQSDASEMSLWFLVLTFHAVTIQVCLPNIGEMGWKLLDGIRSKSFSFKARVPPQFIQTWSEFSYLHLYFHNVITVQHLCKITNSQFIWTACFYQFHAIKQSST